MPSEPGPAQGKRRPRLVRFWRVVNPLARPLSGIAPWWVLLETTGRQSGRRRRTPLATGPVEDGALWLIAVHGRHASWVKNLEAAPAVRVRIARRWREGTASVHPYYAAFAVRFNRYARSGPRMVGIDPVLVRVDLARNA